MKTACLYILLITILYSCSPGAGQNAAAAPVKDSMPAETPAYVQWEKVPCNQAGAHLDTLFPMGIRLSLKTFCDDSTGIYDSITDGKNTWVRHYGDLIISALYKTPEGSNEFQITRYDFGDSLAPDLKSRGLMGFPYEVFFEKSDTSIRLRSFIGFPESDFGDILYYKINRHGEMSVLAVEEVKIGGDM